MKTNNESKPIQFFADDEIADDVKMKLVNRQRISFNDQTCYLATTLDEQIFYLVPIALVDKTEKDGIFSVNIKKVFRPYDWEKEILETIKDFKTVRYNILRSFYLAGAFRAEDRFKQGIRQRMWQNAFPFVQKFFNSGDN